MTQSHEIHIASGIGIANTELGAFDAALNKLGVENRNLLYLSSVIPPNSEVIIHDAAIPAEHLPGEWGDRLYVVKAEKRTATPGEQVWAGIGWWQDPSDGKGLFVEHDGPSEEYVRTQIDESLKDLLNTRGISQDVGSMEMQVIGATCEDKPVSAMVMAAYQASGWDNSAHFFHTRNE